MVQEKVYFFISLLLEQSLLLKLNYQNQKVSYSFQSPLHLLQNQDANLGELEIILEDLEHSI